VGGEKNHRTIQRKMPHLRQPILFFEKLQEPIHYRVAGDVDPMVRQTFTQKVESIPLGGCR
jgi:hypothetical protein